jgi:glycosyltransferase involved in cell wall biosynthesis
VVQLEPSVPSNTAAASLQAPVQSVLVVHNYYQQAGGEDQVYAAEAALLRAKGHQVTQYEDRNDRIGNPIKTGFNAVWNHSSYRRLQAEVRSAKPDIAHFHNTFPLISPAAYYALRSQGVPLVQTLHNYRLVCPGATLFRSGHVCDECIDRRSFLPALVHGCYRNSRTATASTATMLRVHGAAGTWRRMVDVYIALSDFVRRKVIEGGLPAERIVIKPNFVAPDPGIGQGQGGFALFVGRLSEEKGIQTLAHAWREIAYIPLLIAGDGPLSATQWPANVTTLGWQPRDRVAALMKDARFLVFSSIWYECSPLTILEAFACGLPVIASNLGSLPEFVEHRRTGLLFRPGDAQDLAQQVRWAFDHPQEMAAMRVAARREYEEKYSAERNYKVLIGVYEMALENARRRQREAS